MKHVNSSQDECIVIYCNINADNTKPKKGLK